jgi:hypothetical protein
VCYMLLSGVSFFKEMDQITHSVYHIIFLHYLNLTICIFFCFEKIGTFDHKYYTHGEERCKTYVMPIHYYEL